MSQSTREERDERNRKLQLLLGDLLQRDDILSHVASMHVNRNPFNLANCLAEMVRYQTVAKKQCQEIAIRRVEKVLDIGNK